MARPETAPGLPRLITLAAVAIVTLGLYLGKEVLMPLAFAMLLSFMLAPLVTRLERLGMPRILSVIVVAGLSFTVLGSIGYFVGRQLIELTESLPAYRQNIRQRVQDIRGRPSSLSRAVQSVEELTADIATTRPGTAPALPSEPAYAEARMTQPPREEEPLPVTIVSSETSPFSTLRTAASWLLKPLGTAAVVAVFVIFILIQREDLRDRLIYLLGRGHIHLTTQALDDASQRISRYLLMQLVINVTYGIPVAIGLYFLDVPNPLVWGALATLLRYLPYIGPWIAALLPILLSFAVHSDWWHPLVVIGMFIVLEIISNNVMEPWLYGSSTGLSSVAVILSAVFWTWLWGPVGLLLATPLTACAVVAGRYVPQLEFLNVLLGDQPVWDESSRFYQRLLALDEEEATEVIEDYLKEKSLIEVYDDVVLPAMHLAERDRHRDRLSGEREEFIRQALGRLIEDLEESSAVLERSGDARKEEERDTNGPARDKKRGVQKTIRPPAPAPPVNPPRVLCLPAHDEADELAGRMFAQVLRKAGYPAEAASIESLASEMIQQVETSGARIVCISSLPPAALPHSRYLCKRLNARFKQLKMVVGLWNAAGDMAHARERLSCLGASKAVRTLGEALHEIRQFNLPVTAEK